MSISKGLTLASASTILVCMALPAAAQTATATLKNANGGDVGTAEMTQTPAGVLIKLSVKGLPPGDHASTSMRSENANRLSKARVHILTLRTKSMA